MLLNTELSSLCVLLEGAEAAADIIAGNYLKALEYGVLGLCAITLILVWKILHNEQRREGNPRKGILCGAYVFMIFCLLIAIFSGYVELKEKNTSIEVAEKIKILEVKLRAKEDELLQIKSAADGVTEQIKTLENNLRAKEDKLLQIKSAADPILYARSDIVKGMPPGSDKDKLSTLMNLLIKVLK